MGGMLLSKILQMSLVGCYTLCIVWIVRLFLKRIGRKYCYYLWFVVFLNLCVPVSVYSSFSLIPKTIQQNAVQLQQISKEDDDKTEPASDPENMVLLHYMTMEKYEEADVFETPVHIFAQEEIQQTEPTGFSWKEAVPVAEKLWFAGIFGFTLYSLSVSIRFHYQLKRSKKRYFDKKTGIIEVKQLSSPFVWGIVRPKIYLPADMDEKERSYVLMHETYHRKRKDHIAKILFYMITVLHWFNPMVWLAYHLCCKDMEISCDEAVLERSEKNIRKAYAQSLLKFAAKQNRYVFTPLTFGEPSVRSRIENVLKYRKKGVFLSVSAILLIIVIGIGLLTYPKTEIDKNASDPEIEQTELSDSLKLEIRNNGGEVIKIGSSLYYDHGRELYSDGRYLYGTMVYEDGSPSAIYRYEFDGSGFKHLTEGTIAGISHDLKKLYYISESENEIQNLYQYDLSEMQETLLFEKETHFLLRTENQLFGWRKDSDGILLECMDLDSDTKTEFRLQDETFPDNLTCMYTEGDHVVAAAGTYEGSAGYFYGNFYYYNVNTGQTEKKHLTDADTFQIFDGYLYYQKYSNLGEGGNDLYRVPFDLSEEELIGEGETLLSIDRDNNRLITEKDNGIFFLSCDGKERKLLFGGTEMIEQEFGKLHAYDHLKYTELNVIGDLLFVKAECWGYEEGNGWRDSLLSTYYFKIDLNGSGYQRWNPEELLKEQELSDWLNDPIPGKPISDLSQWNMEEIIDVRENFRSLSYDPEEGAEKETWLLGKTEHYTLYGRGGQEQMLLEYKGHYAEIAYTFTSNYMTPLELFESDFDHDGSEELAIKFNIKHGTGVYIDTFFMADFGKDGELYVYQFLDEDCTAQFQEHISYEVKENGVQAKIDGKDAGRFLENEEGLDPYISVACGNQLRFYYENGQITAGAELQFLNDETGGYCGWNSSDITAVVNWDDGQFVLTDFTSRNRELEEMISVRLEEECEAEVIEGFEYDPFDMNRETLDVVVTFRKKGEDSYEKKTVRVKRFPIDYISGWEIQEIL